jgi:large subunit ribosomal protein L4
MPQLAKCNSNGDKVGEVEVSEEIFGQPLHRDLVHQAVVVAESHRKRHAGNAKRRGEIAVTGAKLWRQKGLGRARHGDRGAPIFVGGGKAHAPKARPGNKQMPRKMRRKALFSVLSEATRRRRVKVVVLPALEAPRTRAIVQTLDALNAPDERVLLMLSADEISDQNLVRSCRNVPSLHLRQSPHLNARDVLWAQQILFTEAALAALSQLAGEGR